MNFAQCIDIERDLVERNVRKPGAAGPSLRVHALPMPADLRARKGIANVEQHSGVTLRVLLHLATQPRGAQSPTIARLFGVDAGVVHTALFTLVKQGDARRTGAKKPYTYHVTSKGRNRAADA